MTCWSPLRCPCPHCPVRDASLRASGERQGVPSMWMSSGMEVGLLQLTDFLSLGDVHAGKKGKCSIYFLCFVKKTNYP